MLTILITTAFLLFAYPRCHSLPALALLSVATVAVMLIADPALRSLPILAHLSALAIVFGGLTVLIPALTSDVQFRMIGRVPELRIGRLSLAVVPA